MLPVPRAQTTEEMWNLVYGGDDCEGMAAVLSSDLVPRLGSLPDVCGAALAVDRG